MLLRKYDKNLKPFGNFYWSKTMKDDENQQHNKLICRNNMAETILSRRCAVSCPGFDIFMILPRSVTRGVMFLLCSCVCSPVRASRTFC